MLPDDTDFDPSKIQPFEVANTMVFLGGNHFDPHVPSAVFGMITGVRSHVLGVENGIEIRRILTRAPRMEEQLEEYLTQQRRGSMTPDAVQFGVGWAFRDKAGWGYGLYFEDCAVLRSYEEMSGLLPVVEDVLVVRYTRKVSITDALNTRVVTAAAASSRLLR
jgi:hypothetical protein